MPKTLCKLAVAAPLGPLRRGLAAIVDGIWVGVGAQQQSVIAPAGADQQRQRVPFGLIDLIHPAARQLFIPA